MSTKLRPKKTQADVQAAQQEIALLEQKIRLQEGLPHLHGMKHYVWSRRYVESRNRMNLLCAANQIGKSTVNIRKAILWATSPELWFELWPKLRDAPNKVPNQFWYFYPTGNQTKIEFLTKWKPLLPKGEFKDHPIYGWRDEWVNKELFAIHFNSGVSIFFKSYAQSVLSLQSATVFAMFCDEELPEELYPELVFRLSAYSGYFHMVFTATIGQDFWKQALEPDNPDEEKFPDALKIQVSMYDCLCFEDGTPAKTKAEIDQTIAMCKNHTEVMRRVFGKFVLEAGRKYDAFDAKEHLKQGHPLPKDWLIYAGVDVGGGGKSHPSAICFVGVSPDFRQGRVFLGWRGDGEVTTAADVYNKFCELRGRMTMTGQYYDWASKDFFTIVSRVGEPFVAADKGHEIGEKIINVLFRNKMLLIYDTPELRKLAGELSAIKRATPKNKAKDDFADALRYAITRIPWDWSVIADQLDLGEDKKEEKGRAETEHERVDRERRESMMKAAQDEEARIEDEFREWNEQYGEADGDGDSFLRE